MKTLAFVIILLSLCGKLIKNFLPRGEKSPLYAPLRFLLSISLILVVIFPLTSPFKRETFNLKLEPLADINSGEIILEKMQSTIKRSVDTAFPKEEYSLEIQTDEKGIPNLILVTGGERADSIADFISRNYGLKTTTA